MAKSSLRAPIRNFRGEKTTLLAKFGLGSEKLAVSLHPDITRGRSITETLHRNFSNGIIRIGDILYCGSIHNRGSHKRQYDEMAIESCTTGVISGA